MIFEIITLMSAVPVGYLIAYLGDDELNEGKRWFRIIFILGLFTGGWFFLTGDKSVSFTGFFISIVSIISYIKGKPKKEGR